MPVLHAKSNTIPDFTGTVTVLNSAGATATAAATNLVRPSDWNSGHNEVYNLAGNTFNASSTSGTNIYIAASGPLSVGASAGSIVFSAPQPYPDRAFKEVIQGERLTTIVGLSATDVTNRALFLPFYMEGSGLIAKTVRFMLSFGASSNRSLIATFHAGLYSLNNTSQMTLLGSDSMSFSSTNTANSASWNGVAWFDFTGLSNVTCTTEGRYMLAFQCNPGAANVSNIPVTMYGADNMPAQSRVFNGSTTRALVSNEQFIPFWGAYSTTTASLPSTVSPSQIVGASSQFQFKYYAAIKEI